MGVYKINDIIGSPVQLKNGSVAGYVLNKNGNKVYRIIESNANSMSNARSKPRYSKRITPEQAKQAFEKAYKGNPKGRRADLCRKNKVIRNTEGYRASYLGKLTGPLNSDYPGLDDGSSPECRSSPKKSMKKSSPKKSMKKSSPKKSSPKKSMKKK